MFLAGRFTSVSILLGMSNRNLLFFFKFALSKAKMGLKRRMKCKVFDLNKALRETRKGPIPAYSQQIKLNVVKLQDILEWLGILEQVRTQGRGFRGQIPPRREKSKNYTILEGKSSHTSVFPSLLPRTLSL